MNLRRGTAVFFMINIENDRLTYKERTHTPLLELTNKEVIYDENLGNISLIDPNWFENDGFEPEI